MTGNQEMENMRWAFNFLDKNSDMLVGRDEFNKIYLQAGEKDKFLYKLMFYFLERDDTEGIDFFEFIHVAKLEENEQADFLKEFCKKLFKLYDKNNDGLIDLNEFSAFAEYLNKNYSYTFSSDELKKEFESFDSIKDGKITFEEMEKYFQKTQYEFEEELKFEKIQKYQRKNQFNEIDTDKDGLINFDEFKKYENFDSGLHKEENFKKTFEEIDTDHDGKISFEDCERHYEEAMEKARQEYQKDKAARFTIQTYCRKIFNKYDLNRDGFIDLDDLKHLSKSNNLESSDEEIIAVFQEIDLDKDGKISFIEMSDFIQKISEE